MVFLAENRRFQREIMVAAAATLLSTVSKHEPAAAIMSPAAPVCQLLAIKPYTHVFLMPCCPFSGWY